MSGEKKMSFDELEKIVNEAKYQVNKARDEMSFAVMSFMRGLLIENVSTETIVENLKAIVKMQRVFFMNFPGELLSFCAVNLINSPPKGAKIKISDWEKIHIELSKFSQESLEDNKYLSKQTDEVLKAIKGAIEMVLERTKND